MQEETQTEPVMLRIDQTDYTGEEVSLLGWYIHDRLWERGLGHASVEDLYYLAELAAGFMTTKEGWEDGRENLQLLGMFIADKMLDEILKHV